jgi:beta-glucosidase
VTAEPGLDDLTALVGKLDLDAKLRLLSGASFWTTAEEPTIGLGVITVSDGPVGVRGPLFDEREVAASFPSASALAASFDDDLLRRLGAALAGEAARQKVHVVLGPTINLHRSPLGGRHFECYSEDPYLTGRLATAYVGALQANGVGACPKHYVANDAETDRTTVNNILDERTLREVYLAPFEAVVVDTSPWTVMAAYNAVNGTSMTENDLLADPLKGEWDWDGLVVSDWGAVYRTVESARAAVDLAMPGPDPKWGEPLLDAVKAGEVPEADLDEKLIRLFRLAARVGTLSGFDRTGPQPFATAVDDARPLAREAAIAGTVLLRNEGLLPLQPEGLGRVAMIGARAFDLRYQGGGSAMVFTAPVVQPYAALTSALGDGVEVVTAAGPGSGDMLRPVRPDELDDASVRWLDEAGKVLTEEAYAGGLLYRSQRTLDPQAVSMEIRTRFVPTCDGSWRVGATGIGSFELDLDGKLALTETVAEPAPGVALAEIQAGVNVELAAGTPVDVTLRYRWVWPQMAPVLITGLVVQEPTDSDDAEIARAVEAARSADVAVVMVGTTEYVETEGRDRADLGLPGRQDDLVAAVAAANPRTVVVVNAGAPVEMPWRDDVAALLVTWFPGFECGNALADILLGEAEPGGRLPTTWPADMASAPIVTTTPTDGVIRYDEGLHIGYRAYLRNGAAPAYWFGYGLGYTTWEYEALEATATQAHVRLRNTGSRRGKQVVQVYVSRPDSALDRPAQVLAGYAVVHADPGESVDVDVPIDPRMLRHWDIDTRGWKVEAGPLVVRTGPHAGDLPLHATVELAGT